MPFPVHQPDVGSFHHHPAIPAWHGRDHAAAWQGFLGSAPPHGLRPAAWAGLTQPVRGYDAVGSGGGAAEVMHLLGLARAAGTTGEKAYYIGAAIDSLLGLIQERGGGGSAWPPRDGLKDNGFATSWPPGWMPQLSRLPGHDWQLPRMVPHPVAPGGGGTLPQGSIGAQAAGALRDGGSVKFAMDKTYDSKTYTGDAHGRGDAAGTILIQQGAEYTVSRNRQNGAWITSGFNEAHQRVISGREHPYFGDLGADTMNVWGRGVKIGADGSVFDPEYGRIGRIVAINGNSVQPTPPPPPPPLVAAPPPPPPPTRQWEQSYAMESLRPHLTATNGGVVEREGRFGVDSERAWHTVKGVGHVKNSSGVEMGERLSFDVPFAQLPQNTKVEGGRALLGDLRVGETAMLDFYNRQGQLIDTKQVSGDGSGSVWVGFGGDVGRIALRADERLLRPKENDDLFAVTSTVGLNQVVLNYRQN